MLSEEKMRNINLRASWLLLNFLHNNGAFFIRIFRAIEIILDLSAQDRQLE